MEVSTVLSEGEQPKIEEAALDEDRGGIIRRQYLVDCATCAEWDDVETESVKEAERLFRIRGWSETDKFGWICPKCKVKDRSKLTKFVLKTGR